MKSSQPQNKKTQSFISQYVPKIILGGLILLTLLIVCGVLTAIYCTTHVIFPSYISFAIVLYTFYRMIYTVCRMLTFPGSSWLWKRNIELHFAREMAVKTRDKIFHLESLTEHILIDSQSKTWDSYIDLFEIRKLISSLCHIFSKQLIHRTLSKSQKKLSVKFEALQKLLKDANIIKKTSYSADVFPLWTILKQNIDLTNSYDGIILFFEDKNKGTEILQVCRSIKLEMEDITMKKRFFSSIYRWITNDSLGTIDQVREELETRYEGKNIKLQAAKGVTLDCMILLGKANEDGEDTNRVGPDQHASIRVGNVEDSIDVFDTRTARNRVSNPTMIFCNPNAGIYEFMYYESEWIEFYINKGMNVFVWNYRGYGRSGGSPTPKNLKKDGETIVNYLRVELNVKKIGVHGESLGGLVASHLARHANIDYVCVDRTFSSLTDVVRHSFGKFLGALYRAITGWSDDTSENFIQAPCFKIITFDPKDEVIPLLSSLRYNITRKVIDRIFGDDPNILKRRRSILNYFKPVYNKLNEQRNEDLSELLTPAEAEAVFNSLHRVSEVFVEMSKIQQLPRKKPRRAGSTDQSIKKFRSPIRLPGHDNKEHIPGGSLDSSINLSVIEKDRNGLEDIQETIINPVKPHLKKKPTKNAILDDSVSFVNESRYLDESVHIDKLSSPSEKIQHHPTEGLNLTANNKVVSYLNLLGEEEKNSESLQKLTYKLFSLFGSLEAGGIYLVDVFTSKNSYGTFEEFLISLEIWGSYFPLRQIYEYPNVTIEFFHRQALHRIKEFIRRLDNVIASQKSRDLLPLEAKIMEDLELISNLFPSIYQKLSLAYNKHFYKEEESKDGSFSQGAESGQVDKQSANISPTTNEVITMEASIGNYLSFQTVGHLLPLSCGHNGALNKMEATIYEHYLKKSGFVKF